MRRQSVSGRVQRPEAPSPEDERIAMLAGSR